MCLPFFVLIHLDSHTTMGFPSASVTWTSVPMLAGCVVRPSVGSDRTKPKSAHLAGSSPGIRPVRITRLTVTVRTVSWSTVADGSSAMGGENGRRGPQSLEGGVCWWPFGWEDMLR